MADLTIPVYDLVRFGEGYEPITLTAAETSDDNLMANDGHTILLVFASGGAITATLTGVATATNFNQAKNIAVSLTTNKYSMYGPFPTEMFNTSGNLVITTTDSAMQMCGLRVPPNWRNPITG